MKKRKSTTHWAPTRVSDENYEVIKDNPWYMGSVGPDLETVYQAGCDMTEFFLDKGARNIVIMSGGASVWKSDFIR